MRRCGGSGIEKVSVEETRKSDASEAAILQRGEGAWRGYLGFLSNELTGAVDDRGGRR